MNPKNLLDKLAAQPCDYSCENSCNVRSKKGGFLKQFKEWLLYTYSYYVTRTDHEERPQFCIKNEVENTNGLSFGNSYDSRDYFFFADLPTNKIDWSVDDFGGLFAEFSRSFVTSLEMSVHPFWTSGPGTNSKSPKLNFKSNPALSFDIGIFGGCVNILGLDWRNIYFRWGWCFQKSMLWKISDVYLVFQTFFSMHILEKANVAYQNISQL